MVCTSSEAPNAFSIGKKILSLILQKVLLIYDLSLRRSVLFSGNVPAVEFDQYCIKRLGLFNLDPAQRREGLRYRCLHLLSAVVSGDPVRGGRNVGHDSSHFTGEIKLINP